MPKKFRLSLCFAIWIGLFAIWGYRGLRKPRAITSLPTAGGRELFLVIEVDPFRQNDPRWGDIRLGPTDASLAGYGCTVCATAMALSSQGYPILPDQLNARLMANNGYTESGLLVWKSVEAVSDGSVGVVLNDQPTHDLLDAQLEMGNPVIAKVLYDGRIWHWVLIVGKDGQEYLMHDPLADATLPTPFDDYPMGIFSVRYLKNL